MNLDEAIENFCNEEVYLNFESTNKIVLSGIAVHHALCMCFVGSSEKTTDKLKTLLKIDKQDDLANYKYILQSLQNLKEADVNINSKIYIDKKITIKKKFMENLKIVDNIEIEKINFLNSKKSLRIMNSDIKKQIRNEEILNQFMSNDIDNRTKMYIVNTICLNARWHRKLNLRSSKIFHMNKNIEKTVMMMGHSFDKIFYKKLDEIQFIGIPFEDNDLILMIIIPNEVWEHKEFQNNKNKFNIDYNVLEENVNWLPMNLEIPKLKINLNINLGGVLNKMVDIFGQNPNFKRISKTKSKVSLSIKNMKQILVFNIDEDGIHTCKSDPVYCTEEKATPIVNDLLKKMVVNKPFIFKIANKKSKITLLSGLILDPS